jgi:hypothetical protein
LLVLNLFNQFYRGFWGKGKNNLRCESKIRGKTGILQFLRSS